MTDVLKSMYLLTCSTTGIIYKSSPIYINTQLKFYNRNIYVTFYLL